MNFSPSLLCVCHAPGRSVTVFVWCMLCSVGAVRIKGNRSSLLFFSLQHHQESWMGSHLLQLYQTCARLQWHGGWEPPRKHFSLHLITGTQREATWGKLDGWVARRWVDDEGRTWNFKVFLALFKQSELVREINMTGSNQHVRLIQTNVLIQTKVLKPLLQRPLS